MTTIFAFVNWLKIGSMKNIIGIIGGAGVAATNLLNQLIESQITKDSLVLRDSDHPEIITYQAVSVPSRSMFYEGRGSSFIPGYIDIGLRLKNCGATVLSMNCNTAHAAIDEIQNAVSLPFLNMISSVVLEVKKTIPRGRVGILTSDGCRMAKVYEKNFFSLGDEYDLIYPNSEHQKLLTTGICNIKNSNRFVSLADKRRPFFIFNQLCRHLLDQKVDAIIIGCTDISVDFMVDSFNGIPVIDSLMVLSRDIIRVSKTGS